RSGVIVREMTKLHEEVLPITLTDNFDQEIIGEMVLILEGEEKKANLESLTPMEHLMGYINSGMDKNDAIKLVAKERKVPKNEIYKLLNND
ncbi:MAG: 16S rRNA (cytidine(1402)-2'-O)-methyltransferase, partial [Clostridia bacterium]|nr:16S rRNA (cytidine(1402)-2'-O)-methyltransferase [Clostridia bacterium]